MNIYIENMKYVDVCISAGTWLQNRTVSYHGL